MARNRQDSKTGILEAALDVVKREGAQSLTIDAVAEESGFSKGGVLYNFPTKDALITGMVEFLACQFETEIAAARKQHLSSPCPTLSAMIDITEGWMREKRDVARAMLAVHANRPELSEPFLSVKSRLKAAISEETDDLGMAWSTWSCLEGLHFSEAHRVAIWTAEERALVFEDLRQRMENQMNVNRKST